MQDIEYWLDFDKLKGLSNNEPKYITTRRFILIPDKDNKTCIIDIPDKGKLIKNLRINLSNEDVGSISCIIGNQYIDVIYGFLFDVLWTIYDKYGLVPFGFEDLIVPTFSILTFKFMINSPTEFYYDVYELTDLNDQYNMDIKCLKELLCKPFRDVIEIQTIPNYNIIIYIICSPIQPISAMFDKFIVNNFNKIQNFYLLFNHDKRYNVKLQFDRSVQYIRAFGIGKNILHLNNGICGLIN